MTSARSLVYSLLHEWRCQIRNLWDRCRTSYHQERLFCNILLAWLLFFSLVRTLQHFSFGTNAWDLSIFDYALSGTVKGAVMAEPFHGSAWGSHLGVHFMPILFLLLPLYLVFKGPLLLLYIQVLAVGGASLPLYQIAKRRLQDHRTALAVAVSYLLFRPLLNGLMYDFHPEMFFPLLIFSSFYFIDSKRRPIFFIASILLALAVKEDFALYVFFYCLWLARTKSQRKIALGAALLSAIYIALTFAFWIPYFRSQVQAPSTYEFIDNWKDYGDSPAQITRNALAHPGRVLRDVAPLSRSRHLLNYFLPLLFIPLLSPSIALILPPLAVGWLSRIPAMTSFGLHYGAALIPFVFLALIAGVYRLRVHGGKSRQWLVILLLAAGIANFKWNLVLPAQYRHIRDYPALRSCLRLVPAQASLAAQSCLVPHVPKRREIVLLPAIGASEYILFDPDLNPWPLSHAELLALDDRLQHSPNYRLVCGTNSFRLYQKTGI